MPFIFFDYQFWHLPVSPLLPVVSYTLSKSAALTLRLTIFQSLVWLETDRVSSELIYPRNVPADARTNVPSPRQFGISDYEDLQIPTPDGESLHAFFIRPANKQHARNITVLMFHGNAGNIGHRVPIAKVLQEILGCNVLMLEYRGYGLSTGVPDEAGLKIDAQTGFDYLRQRAETRNTTIIVYGQSLGGAVAINLVAENQDSGDVGGLILENTFLSIRKLIPT
jgi:pimeloyl-ACP methyl ester carboxylesterase